MKKFIVHRGVAAPLLRNNVDTDAIIPSREMKQVSKQGLGGGLFAGWRYKSAGSRSPNPDFVLNWPEYEGASILLAGRNFGCGSSREHAAWALSEYGIRAVIAPGFGVIFQGNCERNGILPVVLEEAAVRSIADVVAPDPQRLQVEIDLRRNMVTAPDGREFGFEIASSSRRMLLDGQDQIGITLGQIDTIENFEQRWRERRPWLFEEREEIRNHGKQRF